MRIHLATRDIFRIFTVLEHVSADIKTKVMTQAQIDYQMQLDLDDHLEQCGEWGR